MGDTGLPEFDRRAAEGVSGQVLAGGFAEGPEEAVQAHGDAQRRGPADATVALDEVQLPGGVLDHLPNGVSAQADRRGGFGAEGLELRSVDRRGDLRLAPYDLV